MRLASLWPYIRSAACGQTQLQCFRANGFERPSAQPGGTYRLRLDVVQRRGRTGNAAAPGPWRGGYAELECHTAAPDRCMKGQLVVQPE